MIREPARHPFQLDQGAFGARRLFHPGHDAQMVLAQPVTEGRLDPVHLERPATVLRTHSSRSRTYAVRTCSETRSIYPNVVSVSRIAAAKAVGRSRAWAASSR